jgi:hypothetical protein
MTEWDRLIKLVLIDTEKIDKLPKVMKERAMWARGKIAANEGEIDFGRYGDGYTFAVYNPEDDRYYDIDGSYHAKSPSRTLVERQIKHKERFNWAQTAQAIRERVTAELHMTDKEASDSGLHVLGWKVRGYPEPMPCADCGTTERRRVSHHLDPQLKQHMDESRAEVKKAWRDKDPVSYEHAFGLFFADCVAYYFAPESARQWLCDKCHRRRHNED